MILVTGGTGYIGSHTVVELLAAGKDVLILDNYANSSPKVLERIADISGRRPAFREGDIRDADGLRALFAAHRIEAVIHFAGLKAVGESVEQPLTYYDNNVNGTLCLLQAMRQAGVRRLVFSSSATVYGEPEFVPINESAPLRTTNPYGRSKLHVEEILRDLAASDASWRLISLRYFNPVGAHESGLLGEDPNGIPNNLMPFIAKVATGQLPELGVFGNDYDTPDGTGVRDYIHVMDLADGHLKALEFLQKQAGWHTINLGTGRGYSVLDMLRAFERASGKTIPYAIKPRRPGDLPSYWAKTDKAEQVLGWRAQREQDAMCADTWRWQQFAANL